MRGGPLCALRGTPPLTACVARYVAVARHDGRHLHEAAAVASAGAGSGGGVGGLPSSAHRAPCAAPALSGPRPCPSAPARPLPHPYSATGRFSEGGGSTSASAWRAQAGHAGRSRSSCPPLPRGLCAHAPTCAHIIDKVLYPFYDTLGLCAHAPTWHTMLRAPSTCSSLRGPPGTRSRHHRSRRPTVGARQCNPPCLSCPPLTSIPPLQPLPRTCGARACRLG
jgi:hypothetical protein